jgi:hypothetical protein
MNKTLVRNVEFSDALKPGQWNSYSCEISRDGVTWEEAEGQGSPVLGIEVVIDKDYNEVFPFEIID